MKNIKELNLELIELEDQVLLVDKRIQPVNNWYFDTYIKKVKNTSGAEYAKDSQVIQIISSTKPLEGLPLLVIEDEVKKLAKNHSEYRFKKSDNQRYFNETSCEIDFIEGYNKALQKFKFTEEDLRIALSEAFKASQEGYQITSDEIIQSLNKKELWIEVENYCGSPYTTERCPKCVDSCDRAYQRPKIVNNQIKAIWK